MSKLDEARKILEALGLPKKQQNERSALTLLALCNVKKTDKWSQAKQVSMSVVGNRKNPKYPGVMVSLLSTMQYATPRIHGRR
jgi:hypothetical protein